VDELKTVKVAYLTSASALKEGHEGPAERTVGLSDENKILGFSDTTQKCQ
jgi:hypothetical protein